MGEGLDFFISYTQADRAWAEWIAWTLEEAGYKVRIQAWDFRPGSNFVVEMQRAAAEADRQKEFFEARGYHERALAIREKVLGPEHPDTAMSLTSLGFILERRVTTPERVSPTSKLWIFFGGG